MEFKEENEEVLHCCDGHCDEDHGYWCSEDELELVEDEQTKTLGETIDTILNVVKDNPAVLMQKAGELLKEKDQEIEKLKNDYQSLSDDFKYLDGYIDGMKYVLELKEEK